MRPGRLRRDSRDDRTPEEQVRLYLLHWKRQRGQDHRRGGRQEHHSVHAGARRQEPRLHGRVLRHEDGRQETHLGKDVQRGTGRRSGVAVQWTQN